MKSVNFNPLITVMVGISIFMWMFTHFFRPEIPPNSLSPNSSVAPSQPIMVSSGSEGIGLDLQTLLAIAKEAQNASDLEAKINAPEGINNLDLNRDGQVDFIQVNEFRDRSTGDYGFSLTVEPEEGKLVEIATIEIKPRGKEVEVSSHGNENLYGSSKGYSSIFPATSFFLLGYLLNSSSFYTSPFGYSRYPSYYSPFSTSPRSDYIRRSSQFRSGYSTTPNRGPTMNSPFSGVRRGLRNSSGFQRSFGGLGRKEVGSGGFGNRRFFSDTSRRNPFGSFGSGFGRNRGLSGISSRRSFGGLRGLRGFRGFRGLRGFRR